MNVLRFGSQGSAVRLVQTILSEHPKPATWTSTNPRSGALAGARSWPQDWSWPIATDGDFGAKTEAAVEAFQHARGLVADGVVGGNTWAALLEGREIIGPIPTLRTKSEQVPVGSRLVDSYPFSLGGTSVQAKALRQDEVDGLIGYLGVINQARFDAVLDAGLGFMAVTLANRFDGVKAVQQAQALGYPPGASVALDIEGRKILNGVDWPSLAPAQRDIHAREIFGKCLAWRDVLKQAGYKTLLYVGSPQPLTTKELTDLSFDGYWNALSRESDRNGALAEPLQGWCLWQMIPELHWRTSGVWVDANMAGQDFRKRLPYWSVRS